MNEYKVENEFGMSEYPTVLEFVSGALFVVGMFAMDGPKNKAGIVEGTKMFMTHGWLGDNRLYVKESLDDVSVKWARAMRVEEME